MTEKKDITLDDLPEFIPEAETRPLEIKEEASQESKQAVVKKENSDPAYTLGNYKNLTRIAKFKFGEEELPLYGRATYTFNPYREKNSGDNEKISLAIPTTSMVVLNSAAEAITSLNFDKDAGARAWAAQIDKANELNPVQDAFIKAMNRENSDWKQIPKSGDKMLVGALSRREDVHNVELKDNQALLYALSALNLGAPFQAPMWHSGFWVSFRPASEEAWVNFNELLISDKIRIGRAPSGLAFSNVNAIFTERAMNFALDHVLEHNIRVEKNTNRRDLFKKLKAGDIPIFLWAFLVANNPSGYPISRGCSAEIGSCTKVIEDVINLRILQVTDDSCFEQKHRNHMAKNYAGGVSEKDIEDYQSSLLAIQEEEYCVLEEKNSKITITLKHPSVEEYLSSGRRWFDGIVEMVNSILAKDTTDNKREEVYQKYTKAGVLREYSHWIKELSINGNSISDLTSLENVLKEISPHGKLRDLVYKKISAYVEKTTLSVIAVPNYACPSCGEIQREEKKDDKFTDCIPLDVAQAFFNLALLRVVEITRR